MSVFLSYARGDDGEPFDPTLSFVARLHRDLTAAGFDVWFDREDMPSRNLTFHQEIRDAIAARDRLVLVVGPRAATSDYVRQEWQFAWFEAEKVVTPILRQGDYPLVPDELKLLHCEDFRDGDKYAFHLQQLVRILQEPVPPLGKLIAVPSLPAHFLSRPEGLVPLRDALRADLDRPVVISGAAAKVGLHGMGGIGKSVLAAALSHDRKIREAFPDGIIWIGVGALPDLRALMQRVHLDLGGDGTIATEHEGTVKLKDILKNKAALLVLDDIWRRADFDSLDVLGPRCRALITTRDAGLLTGVGKHYVVDLMTDKEARRLLAQAVECETDVLPSAAADLIAECGRLPLAVALAGGMIKAGMPWNDLIEALRQHELEFLENEHAAVQQHRNLWRMIEVSVHALPEDAQSRLAELSVFPPDENIPANAVATLWGNSGQLSERHSRKLLIDLKRRSLVNIAKAESEQDQLGDVSLHGLIHDYAFRRAQQQLGGELALNECILAAYRKRCPAGWWEGPNDGYFFSHLRDHLNAASRCDELADLLYELPWLEAKNAAGLVFDLLRDFRAAQSALSASDHRRRVLARLHEALRRDIQFIHRRRTDYPQGLFQCMWNRCWWYDCAEAHLHFEKVAAVPPPWESRHQLISGVLEKWRRAKEKKTPGFQWIRSLRPPRESLGDSNTMSWRLPDAVTSVAFLDEDRVATSSNGATVVWEIESGSPVLTCAGESVACVPSAGLLFLVEDGRILQFDVHSSSKRCLSDEYGPYCGVPVVSPDGKWLACATKGQKVCVWRVGEDNVHCVYGGHRAVAHHLCFSFDGTRVASCAADRSVHAWRSQDASALGSFTDREWNPLGAVFATHGQSLVSVWNRSVSVQGGAYERQGVRSYSAQRELAIIRELNPLTMQSTRVFGVGNDGLLENPDLSEVGKNPFLWYAWKGVAARSLCYSASRDRIYAGMSDCSMRQWSLSEGRQEKAFHLPRSSEHPEESVLSLGISPSGRTLVCGTSLGTICISSSDGIAGGVGRLVGSVVPDQMRAVAGEHVSGVYGDSSGHLVERVSVSGFGGGPHDHFQLWDARNAQLLLTGYSSYFVSQSGQVIGALGGQSVKLVWPATGREVVVTSHEPTLGPIFDDWFHTPRVEHVLLSKDEKEALTVTDNGSVRMWDLDNEIETAHLVVGGDSTGNDFPKIDPSLLERFDSVRKIKSEGLASEYFAESLEMDTRLVRVNDGAIVGWYPGRLENFALVPVENSTIVAGANGDYLAIMCLDGPERPPGRPDVVPPANPVFDSVGMR